MPNSAAPVDDPFTGTGDPQDVRSYGTHTNTSQNTNGSFPIDAPSTNAYLTNTSVNYTFAQDYTTLHQVTPYSALDYPRVLNGTYIADDGGRFADAIIGSTYLANYTVGEYPNWKWAHDNNPSTFTNYSNNGGVVTFEVYSNFSKLFIDSWVFPGQSAREFASSMCMSLDLNFWGKVSIASVGYTVEARNWGGTDYDVVGTGQLTENATTIQTTIVNPGNIYLNDSLSSHFRVTLTGSGFNLTLYEANATVKVVPELEISASKQVALGFDLKGNASVNGFQVLIRTVGTPSGLFNAGLYRANDTYPSETSDGQDIAHVLDLTKDPVAPEGGPLVNKTYSAPTFNGIITFNFTATPCNVSNYYIVLNSTSTTASYRIGTVPNNMDPWHTQSRGFPFYTDIDPAQKVRHILLNSSYGFSAWNQSSLDSGKAYLLNAAPFAINVTRGWMPEDANMSVQNVLLVGADYTQAHEGPFTDTPGWSWGRGFWGLSYPELTNPIKNTGGRFYVPLTWDQTKRQTIYFNTTFQAASYAVESCVATFHVTASQNPRWTINHTLIPYENWTFTTLAFLYPRTWDFNDGQILGPAYTSVSSSRSVANATHYQQIANNASGNLSPSGVYSLQITSHNAIRGFGSSLNFKNTNYWPTNAFMRGDNISVQLTTQIAGRPVYEGAANVTLFNAAGNRVSPTLGTLETPYFDQIDSGLGVTYYNFSRSNLFNTNSSTPYGKYTAVAKWDNGTEVGFQHLNIYVLNYMPQIISVTPIASTGENEIWGNISWESMPQRGPYDVTIATVNETTGKPSNFLPRTNLTTGTENNVFGEDVKFNYALINETVFQKGETFELNVSVQSINVHQSIDVKVKCELVYYSKQEWRIFEATTAPITLNKSGQAGNQALLNLTGTFPGAGATGLNCPLRNGSIALRLTFIVYEDEIGTWTNPHPFIQATVDEAIFEGQILTTVPPYPQTGPSFGCLVNRAQGCNLPGNTIYFVSVFDQSGVSMETNYSKVIKESAFAQFKGVTTGPLTPTVNKLFDFSGALVSENPTKILNSKTVTFKLFNNATKGWDDFIGTNGDATTTTDSQGFFTKTFNASALQLSNLIRLSYAGDTEHYEGTLNYTLTVIQYANTIQILVDPNFHLTGNLENYISFTFLNSGNSTLENLQISVVSLEGHLMQVVEADYIHEKSVGTGVAVSRNYLVRIPVLSNNANATFTFTIIATAKESLQQVTITQNVTIPVSQGSFLFLSLENLPALIFFLVAGVIWLFIVLFFLRKRRAVRAETGTPRRRLVKFGPKHQVPPEKMTNIPREQKPSTEKPAAKDFDEILEEVKKDKKDEKEDSST